jgi:hypothetical protein
LCPSADAIRQQCWRATDGDVRETASDDGEDSAKPAAAAKLLRRLCLRAKAADVHTEPVSAMASKSASGANGDGDGNVSSKLRRAEERKEGHGKPEGVRLTTGTNSAGANPRDGAKVEKTWQVTKVGAQRWKTAWSTQRQGAQAEQATSNRKTVNPGC